jgi:hypothetical protein
MELSYENPVKIAYMSIVEHLQKILRIDRNKHENLRNFQNDVEGLIQQLDESMKTSDGVRQWQQTLKVKSQQLGCVQYHRACPYGGGYGDLIDTPENKVLQYIHSEIDACITNAFKILEVRRGEEKCKSNPYTV